MRRLVASLCVAVIALTACGDDGSRVRSDADGGTPSSPAAVPTEFGSKPKVTVPSGPPPKQLQTKDLRVGTGPSVKAGDKLLVHYVGVAWSTKQEFDSSWNSGRLFPFTLGTGSVIEGWDRGIVGMRIGGQRELVIPPDLAYGAAGSQPVIGPNETLVFVVDLIRVEQ